MTRAHLLPVLLVAGAACQGPRTEAPRPLTQEEERAAAERGLRRMFPDIEGEITAESIAAQVARSRSEADPAAGVRSETSRAIEAGEFDRARDLLGELLAGEHVERARQLSLAGDAPGALAALDRALEMAPHSPAILCARAEAALAVARSRGSSAAPMASAGASEEDRALLESALANFLEAARGDAGTGEAAADLRVRAWLGASLAAAALGHGERARECAQSGLEAAPRSAAAGRYDVPLRRTLAEASFDAYLGAAQGGAAADVVVTRARESRDALFGLLGRTPEDPWAWERLAELSRSQGAAKEARDVALRGLALAPEDPGLLEDLSLAARALGGPRAVVDALEPFCRRHPDVARAAWELADARFDLAAAALRSGADPRADLAAAEAGFARARAIEPALDERSREREARCRGAIGLWLVERGDVTGARAAFLSIEDVRPGGLALEIQPGAGSGCDGLHRVAQAYAERGRVGGVGSPESIDALEQAALLLDLLHAADPKDARFAFGAGHGNREAAVALELHARGLVRMPPAERNRLLERAREMMERGSRALDDAARLAPEDARVAAEAGAVLVRYLQKEPERARALLEKAVELGEAEVRALADLAGAPGAGERERSEAQVALEEAQTRVGDACLDLGRLHLALLGDPARAREWFEKSRKAGPDPRPEIEGLLERCRAALAGEVDPRVRDDGRWAAPIQPGR